MPPAGANFGGTVRSPETGHNDRDRWSWGSAVPAPTTDARPTAQPGSEPPGCARNASTTTDPGAGTTAQRPRKAARLPVPTPLGRMRGSPDGFIGGRTTNPRRAATGAPSTPEPGVGVRQILGGRGRRERESTVGATLVVARVGPPIPVFARTGRHKGGVRQNPRWTRTLRKHRRGDPCGRACRAADARPSRGGPPQGACTTNPWWTRTLRKHRRGDPCGRPCRSADARRSRGGTPQGACTTNPWWTRTSRPRKHRRGDPCGRPCRSANTCVREDGTPQGRPLR